MPINLITEWVAIRARETYWCKRECPIIEDLDCEVGAPIIQTQPDKMP